MPKEMKRYAVTMDLYIQARDHKHAISKAKMIAKRQDDQYNNRCEVTGVHSVPFASMLTEEIYKK